MNTKEKIISYFNEIQVYDKAQGFIDLLFQEGIIDCSTYKSISGKLDKLWGFTELK